MPGRPIPPSTADTMINNYIDYVQKLQVDPKKKTQYVSFTLSDFQDWLSRITSAPDELRIYMGIYPDDSSDPGRVTTIVWAYKDGRPVAKPIEGKDGGGERGDPFNDGAGMP